MRIINFIRKHKKKRALKRIQPYISLSSDSIYDSSFWIVLSKPQQGIKYLNIGHHCIIGGSFIFETERGHISIGDRVHIGGGMFISRSSITIEDDVTIAWNVLVYDHNSHSVNWNERRNDTEQEYQDSIAIGDCLANKDWNVVKTAPIVIKRKAWIGVGAMILKGVTIGEGAVVGAGAVVTKDVKPWTVVAGNPAIEVKSCFEE